MLAFLPMFVFSQPAAASKPFELGPGLALLIVYFVLAILSSFLCSLAEAVLLIASSMRTESGFPPSKRAGSPRENRRLQRQAL